MKQFFSSCFLLLSLSVMAQTFPRKYVDSLTAIALSRKNSKPKVLNRDSALQQLYKSTSLDDRISMYYKIIYNSGDLPKGLMGYYSRLMLETAQKKGDKVLEAVVMAELGTEFLQVIQ